MNRHLPPSSQGGAQRDIRFAELDTHRTLLAYKHLVAGLAGFFRPTQEMVDFSSKELDQAASKDPPFKPYLTPNLPPPRHWVPDAADHLATQTQWGATPKARIKLSFLLNLAYRAFFCINFVSFWQLNFGQLGLGVTDSALSCLAFPSLRTFPLSKPSV